MPYLTGLADLQAQSVAVAASKGPLQLPGKCATCKADAWWGKTHVGHRVLAGDDMATYHRAAASGSCLRNIAGAWILQ